MGPPAAALSHIDTLFAALHDFPIKREKGVAKMLQVNTGTLPKTPYKKPNHCRIA